MNLSCLPGSRFTTFLEKPRVSSGNQKYWSTAEKYGREEQPGSAFDFEMKYFQLEMTWNSNFGLQEISFSCSHKITFSSRTYTKTQEVFLCPWASAWFYTFKKSTLLRPQCRWQWMYNVSSSRWQRTLRTASVSLVYCFWCEMRNACCVWCHGPWDLTHSVVISERSVKEQRRYHNCQALH